MKNTQSSPETIDSAHIERHDLTDDEVDDLVNRLLKAYFRKTLGAEKVSAVSDIIKAPNLDAIFSKEINDPNFATAAIAYSALRSQEKQEQFNEGQERFNKRIQWLIVFVTIASVAVAAIGLFVK